LILYTGEIGVGGRRGHYRDHTPVWIKEDQD
jgi:hypothetical protein